MRAPKISIFGMAAKPLPCNGILVVLGNLPKILPMSISYMFFCKSLNGNTYETKYLQAWANPGKSSQPTYICGYLHFHKYENTDFYQYFKYHRNKEES